MALIRPIRLFDTEPVCDIYNYYVLNSVATFAIDAIPYEQMRQQIEQTPGEYPWIVLEVDETIVGYAKLSQWKPRGAYRNTVEISVYIKDDQQGKGYGRLLYDELIIQTEALGFHAVLAGICLPNDPSVKFHEAFGFEKVAHFKQTGFKFERWVDVGYWQLLLNND